MLRRHDFVTPYINGVRFFDKPPLMYWMAAASMRLFGVHDWAARLPLALSVLALLLAVYVLGTRLFRAVSPITGPDRGGFYAALALTTSIGPYLYTRFYIPDIVLALWMTLAVHLFLIALERVKAKSDSRPVRHTHDPIFGGQAGEPERPSADLSALLPCLAFAGVMALNVLTKGLIGLVFPVAFVFLYLAVTKQLSLLPKFHLIASTAVFVVIAAPWHVLAALRNPAVTLPPGVGLPARGGWTWFYLYNEHIARFLSRRIPHDYGQTPVWLFWLLAVLWTMPWGAYVPASAALFLPAARSTFRNWLALLRNHEAALSLGLWTIVVLGFFTISARQEYYSLPALPALALLAGAALARAEAIPSSPACHSVLRWHLYFLLPFSAFLAAVCGWFAIVAHRPGPNVDLSTLLAANPEFYNLSLGHIFDLTGAAMGLFRGPLAAVSLSMLAVGVSGYLLRRANRTYAANLLIAAAMTVTLLAAHEGLARFYPVLGSKALAEVILRTQSQQPRPIGQAADLIVLDGELTSGSTLIFYTGQQVHLVGGRVNGLWYGSFWPDAPAIFETESTLRQLWASGRRIFLFTYNAAARTRDLTAYGSVQTLDCIGGKCVLTNH